MTMVLSLPAISIPNYHLISAHNVKHVKVEQRRKIGRLEFPFLCMTHRLAMPYIPMNFHINIPKG